VAEAIPVSINHARNPTKISLAWVFSFSATGFPYIRAVIDTEEKLAPLLPQLSAASWIALDTEADSLHAYPEKLCLIQVSIEGSDHLLDPWRASS